jgi:hypothetical protein
MKHNDSPPMTLARLAELLDAYGAEATRWPAAERAAAEALVANDPRGAELQRAARSLDQHLDMFEVPEPSANLQARVLEIPIRHAVAPARFVLAGWRLAALALVPCALGFASGALFNDEPQEDAWSELSPLVQLTDVADEEWP